MKKFQALQALAAILAAALMIIITPALAANPSFNQAVADYNAGKYGQAASEFELLKASYPTNGLTRYYLALCRQALGHFDKAKQEYEWVATNGDARLKGMAQQGIDRISGVKSSVSHSAPAQASGHSQTASAGSSQSGGKVKKIYKFTATWCGPCKRFAPIFDATKPRFSDVTFEAVDIDQNKELADKYSVSAIPHLVFLDAGGKILYSGGAFQDEESFADAIKKFH